MIIYDISLIPVVVVVVSLLSKLGSVS